MPRVCTACAHPERAALDLALIRGEPMRRIAAEHQLSETAVRRHAANHLPAALVAAGEAREACRWDRFMGEAIALQAKALELVARAETEGDVRAAGVALKEARECVEFRARLGAELRAADAKVAPAASIRVEYVDTQDSLTTKLKALRAALHHPVALADGDVALGAPFSSRGQVAPPGSRTPAAGPG